MGIQYCVWVFGAAEHYYFTEYKIPGHRLDYDSTTNNWYFTTVIIAVVVGDMVYDSTGWCGFRLYFCGIRAAVWLAGNGVERGGWAWVGFSFAERRCCCVCGAAYGLFFLVGVRK